MKPPKPDAIRAARIAAGLTQKQAAALIYAKPRIWQYYEAGTVEMPLVCWELFLLKRDVLATL